MRLLYKLTWNSLPQSSAPEAPKGPTVTSRLSTLYCPWKRGLHSRAMNFGWDEWAKEYRDLGSVNTCTLPVRIFIKRSILRGNFLKKIWYVGLVPLAWILPQNLGAKKFYVVSCFWEGTLQVFSMHMNSMGCGRKLHLILSCKYHGVEVDIMDGLRLMKSEFSYDLFLWVCVLGHFYYCLVKFRTFTSHQKQRLVNNPSLALAFKSNSCSCNVWYKKDEFVKKCFIA